MRLTEPTWLRRLLGEEVYIGAEDKVGVGEPGAEAADGGRGMCAGVKCIDDIDVVRSGAMKALFDGMYAPSTIGMSLREFIFGHTR